MSGVATSRDGVRLAFEVHGAGTPTLVFVHGWSCDRRYWRGQLRPLAARYQTVAVDLAGHGQSGVGRRSWTMAAFGEDVVAVVEQLGLGELGEPSAEEELEAFLAPFREDFAAATRGLVERLFTADADAELLE